MKIKKLLAGIGGLTAVLVSLPMIAAFEAHVINVTAQIENGLFVPIDEIEFGTVFPQQRLDKQFNVSLSESYQGACNAPIGVQYASSVVDVAQGKRKNNTAVLVDRSDTSKALGAPQSTGTPYDPAATTVPPVFFSLGFSTTTPGSAIGGGIITLGFTNYIVDQPGTDITVYEITGGTSYPDEKIRVEIAQTSTGPWVLATTSAMRDVNIDINGLLPWAKYVRIRDVSNPVIFEATADAYDLDAVKATSREVLCGDITYVLRQKPKCLLPSDGSHPQVTEDEEGTFICPGESEMMPLLCPYLSKHEITNDPGVSQENDGLGINAFHGLPLPWNMQTTLDTQVNGMLSVISQDVSDTWNIDLKVPCFSQHCAQDWADFVHEFAPNVDPNDYIQPANLEHEVFGCDLWLEVTSLN